ncbi:MAG: efflux RND transporter permease subunit [Endomicrobiales bacterium]|nr:efflux RND transporter permease subunit [Endomicrobiales bacterium]
MIKLIEYFSQRHLLTNFIMLGVFIGGIFFWFKTGKEEMPDLTMDIMRVTVSYPGASPQEVEYFVAEPIEEKLETVDGIYDMTTNCSQGVCSIMLELDTDFADIDTIVSDVKSAVLDVKMPDGVRDEPRFRQFKTSNKAIIDIGLINKNKRFLDYESRNELQAYARTLENQLLNLPSISEVDWSDYLEREIHILLKPEELVRYNISVNEILNVLRNNNVRMPAGVIKTENDAKVTVLAELREVKTLEELIVRGGFEGQKVRLKQLADIITTFEDSDTISKINGYEGIRAQVRKNSVYGIIESIDQLKVAVAKFKKSSLKGTPIDVVLIDDESRDVRNRLSIISINGAIGFTLIIITLLIFLDLTSAFWVAMGIPFSFCFTMVIAAMMGYTINNITLAAVIIVMGMIVDDAIIVAENVTRFKFSGMSQQEAVVKGTAYVFQPILGSVVTTCIAFVPMLFFEGRFGMFIVFIPIIIFLMLGGSLLESIIILPSHLNIHIPARIKNILRIKNNNNGLNKHWFHDVEDAYGRVLEKVLKHKVLLFTVFAVLLGVAFYIFKAQMKFVMFPNEETTMLSLDGIAPEDTKKQKTAEMTIPIEDVFEDYIGTEVLSVLTSIARSRRGRAARENEFHMSIEVIPKDQRKKSVKQLKKEWLEKIEKVQVGFDEIKFTQHRFGGDSGSPIEIMVRENNDNTRAKVTNAILGEMLKYNALKNSEIEREFRDSEYSIALKRDVLNRLGVTPSSVGTTLRAAVEGITVFEFKEDNEDLYVVLTVEPGAKNNIDRIVEIPVENKGNYLVPLKNVINVDKTKTPNVITRKKGKRKTTVYGDLADTTKKTPLEIAEYFEESVFPDILSKNPTTSIGFEGEVKDTRESKQDFKYAILLVLFLIYAVLAILFNSLVKPIIIMLAIPFGCVGIILAYKLHGMLNYGFFSAIGALGLAGVVINDSIVMLVKLDREFNNPEYGNTVIERIANISKTRVRAVMLTTLTTVAGLIPTAYGIAGYDSMLAEMMLAMAWGLMFGTFITLLLMPSIYNVLEDSKVLINKVISKKALISMVIGLLVISGAKTEVKAFDYKVFPDTSSAKVLALNEFIEKAYKNNLEFQSILIDEAKLVYSRNLSVPAGDIVLEAAGEYILVVDEEGDSELSKEVNLSKLFPSIGTEFEIDYTNAPGRDGTSTKSAFSVSVLQPILNNAFGRANRLDAKIAGMEMDLARYQIVEAYEDYLAVLITLYYNWYSAYESLKAAQSALDESNKLLENIIEKNRQKIAHKSDVDKSYMQNLTKKENVVKLSGDYKKVYNVVRQAINLSDKDKFIPVFSYFRDIKDIEISTGIDKVISESRTDKMLELLKKKGKINVDYYADDLLPSASLNILYRRDEDGYLFSDTVKEDVFMGLYLQKSFPDTYAKAYHRISKVDLEKTQIDTKNKKDEIYTDLLNLYENIKIKQNLVGIAKDKVDAASSVVQSENIFYRQGRSSLNDLIDAINTLDSYKHALIIHQVELNILIVEWLRLSDQLISKKEGNYPLK